MQINKVLTLVIALVMVVGISPAIAQDKPENDALARVVKITAKEGQSKALEEAITNYHHYMGDKEGAWRWQWFSILTGPDTGSYIARSGSHNWEDFDAQEAKKDWSEAAGAKFTSEVQPHIADLDVAITRTDQEIGMWPESMDGYKYFLITHWYIKQGKGKAFNDGLKKIDAVLKESEWANYYAFVYNVSGGHGNQVTLVSPRKNYADMAPKDPKFIDIMNKAMGEEETQAFLSEWSQTYKVGDHYMISYRPKLSDYGQAE